MWGILLFFGLIGLLQCAGTVRLDERYIYLSFWSVVVLVGAVMAPLLWGIAAVVVAVTILYIAERWYARQWDRPRLWWYRFLQDH